MYIHVSNAGRVHIVADTSRSVR